MNFSNKGFPMTNEGIESVCTTLGISAPKVWAVLTVETRGFGFLEDRRPQLLFERHIFHKLTAGKHDKGNNDISNAEPGGYIGGSDEYTRLAKAMQLDRNAALQSASWGVGQVVGFNHKTVGFSTIDEMITEMIKGENEQLLAMANFIKANELAGALQRRDWVAFARGYNGPGFSKFNYDQRLAAAHAKYEVMLPDLILRSAQAALLYLGFKPGPVDGVIGRRTKSALAEFQEKLGLPDTGELDSETEKKLLDEAF